MSAQTATLANARTARVELEAQIFKLLDDFHRTYGIEPLAVHIGRANYCMVALDRPTSVLTGVTVDVRLQAGRAVAYQDLPPCLHCPRATFDAVVTQICLQIAAPESRQKAN